MSYSFGIRAATKALALEAVAAKLQEVATAQQCHQRDQQQALQAAQSFINLLPDDESKDVSVTMSGYLTGAWQGSDVVEISGAAVNVSAGLVQRPEQATEQQSLPV